MKIFKGLVPSNLTNNLLSPRRNKRYLTGFTLVEVLVVIAIIGILTSIIYGSVNQTRAKNRDQKRIADIHEIQLALEYYFNKQGQYPQVLWDETNAKTDLAGFTNKPQPPTNKVENGYFYASLANSALGTRCSSYHLWTRLELPTSALSSRRGYDSTGTSIFTCAGGDEYSRVNAGLPENNLIYDVKP